MLYNFLKQMWAEKYKPKTWQNFVGNVGVVQKCKRWLRDFQNKTGNTPRVLVLSGPEGCGKSLAAELLLQKSGYKTYTFSVNEIKNHKGNKNCLSNFCNLYVADLRKLGAAKSRNKLHAIIIEDFDSLSRNDKTFTGTILKLIKTRPSLSTPLIVTTDDSKAHKISSTLLKMSYHVSLTRLIQRDLIKIAMRVARDENVYLNNDAAALFAEHSYGDARQLLRHMEMFYVGRLNNTRVECDDVAAFLDMHRSDNSRKQCKSFEGDLTMSQSFDERVLGAAVGDRGDKRQQFEKDAALRIACESSIQYTPLLFKAYPLCVLHRADKQFENQQNIEVLADIAESFSVADMIKEQTWGCASYYDMYSALAIRTPIKLIRSNRSDIRDFTLSVAGYQSFYGVENTMKNQIKIKRSLQNSCPAMSTFDITDYGFVKRILGHIIMNKSDDELIEKIFPEGEQYRMHPDLLEMLSRLKGGVGQTYTLTRARKKRLVKAFEKKLDLSAPTVKFVEPEKKKKKIDKNDIFMLDW